jgi:hypothetical protein
MARISFPLIEELSDEQKEQYDRFPSNLTLVTCCGKGA